MSSDRPAPLPGSDAPLGALLSEHRPRPELVRFNRWMAVAGTLGGSACLGIGIWRWVFAYSNYGPVVVWRWSAAWMLVGIPLLLGGLAGIVWLLRWGWIRVFAHKGGLRYARGNRAIALPWAEIQQLFTSGVRYGMFGGWGSRAAVMIVDRENRRVRLNQVFTNLAELVATIKQHTYPRLLADYSRRFRAGQSLPFGPLLLTEEGVQKGTRRLPWRELEAATMLDGRIRLTPKQKRGYPGIQVPAHKVPNVDLCLQLIQHFRGGGTEA